MLQPTILLLREGTDTSQGKAQLISNINACQFLVDTIRTTLGPRGMDKLVYSDRSTTISNDGATIMKLLDVVHPAARTLVEIARAQDEEVGDGTTSVVLLAGELLKLSKEFVEDDVHPTLIIQGLRQACALAVGRLSELAHSIDINDPAKHRDMLEKCAATSMNSKLIGSHKSFFAPMVVDAVLFLDNTLDLELVGIKKQAGGSMEDSTLVKGVAFEKCFSYAGFEQQPKKFVNPKVLVLNIELELKAEKDNAEVRVSNPKEYQSIVEAEWNIIYTRLQQCVDAGVKIVLSRLAIGDLATQFFADRDVFCAGRVGVDDLKRVCKATGATTLTTVTDVTPECLGSCALFEERQIGGQRYNLFSGCEQAKSCTIILRGGGEQFISEMERSLHDALMVVKRSKDAKMLVAGGGAIEMELSKLLREKSRTIMGKQQLIMNSFAKALEVIPRQIAENAGLDATTILNKLRQKHAGGGTWAGVDVLNDDIVDTMETFVWEPLKIKLNCLTAATEAACQILSVDETVKNPQAQQDPNPMA